MAETLKRWCSGDPLGGTGLLLAERLDSVERESRLARDSMEDWRELNDRLLASSSICKDSRLCQQHRAAPTGNADRPPQRKQHQVKPFQ